jgi:hypothetical protein
MRSVPPVLRAALGLSVAFLFCAATASAQPPAAQARPAAQQAAPGPDVHTMEIYNGPMRTVHYIYTGRSPGDQAALRDLENAENNMALQDRLLALQRQYVADESALESRRRTMQELLYGYSTTSAATASSGVGFGFGYPGYFGYGGFGGYGNYPSVGVSTSGTSTSNASLAYGVGDEGAIKTAMAPMLARQATEDSRARASQSLARAWDRVGASPTLMAALNMRAGGVGVPVAHGSGAAVTVTLKNGTKIEGRLVREDADRLVVETDNQEMEIRQSEVATVARPKAGGVAPAVQDKPKP